MVHATKPLLRARRHYESMRPYASLLRSIDLAPLGEALISPSVQAATQHAGNTWLNEPADFELKVVSTVLTEVPTTCSIRNIRTF